MRDTHRNLPGDVTQEAAVAVIDQLASDPMPIKPDEPYWLASNGTCKGNHRTRPLSLPTPQRPTAAYSSRCTG